MKRFISVFLGLLIAISSLFSLSCFSDEPDQDFWDSVFSDLTLPEWNFDFEIPEFEPIEVPEMPKMPEFPSTEAKEETEKFEEESNTSNAPNRVSVIVGQPIVEIGNQRYYFDTIPYIQKSSGSVLVPLRMLSLALAGALTGGDLDSVDLNNDVAWDASTKTATIYAKGKTLKVTVGSEYVTVNGTQIPTSNGAIAEITNGRVFVPLRTIADVFDVNVAWDPNTKMATYILNE